MAVQIQVEGDRWVEDIDRSEDVVPHTVLEQEDVRKKILEAGVVGLGGATFPTHVKLMVPGGKTAEYLIINGAECEPYLTADHMLMMERSSSTGRRQVMAFMHPGNFIGITHKEHYEFTVSALTPASLAAACATCTSVP